MRLLHTSDWHVGRTFHGADLLVHQEQVLTHLAEIVRSEAVDVVVVAGDIYDRAMPSADAVGVLDRVLVAIRNAGAQLVLTPGNHDSGPRLGFLSDVLATGGVHWRWEVDRLAEPVLIDDAHGPVAFYGIPYLEPELARHALGDPALRGHQAVLGVAMDRVRADLAERGPIRSVVLAHCFVQGGHRGDTERDISVGGVEVVPTAVFDGASYVALGHLHGVHTLRSTMRYSGAPLAYSFAEAGRAPGCWLVDLDAAGMSEARWTPLPVPRPISVLTGRIDELLEDPAYSDRTEHWVSARITDPVRPTDPMRRLRQRFVHCVHLEWQPDVTADSPERSYRQRIAGRDDLDVAAEFVDHVRGTPATEGERGLLRDALEAHRLVEQLE